MNKAASDLALQTLGRPGDGGITLVQRESVTTLADMLELSAKCREMWRKLGVSAKDVLELAESDPGRPVAYAGTRPHKQPAIAAESDPQWVADAGTRMGTGQWVADAGTRMRTTHTRFQRSESLRTTCYAALDAARAGVPAGVTVSIAIADTENRAWWAVSNTCGPHLHELFAWAAVDAGAVLRIGAVMHDVEWVKPIDDA